MFIQSVVWKGLRFDQIIQFSRINKNLGKEKEWNSFKQTLYLLIKGMIHGSS